MNALGRFFAPRSVAVIGASATPGRPGRVVIENMRANGFSGAIYPVNPRGGEILGLPALAAIEDLPDALDLAIVILPAAQTPGAIRALGAKGVRSAILVAGGFAEVDHMGEALQSELARAIAACGMRVLGPNTAGHISTPDDFTSSFFPLGRIPRGPISYVAQTGNFTGAMMRHIMTAESYGVARCVGLGNTVDIDETDVLDYLAGDDHTTAIFCYLEGLRRPRAFLDLARGLTCKKPIVLLKGGTSAAGAKAALSHTAALGADDRILDGALAQAGVVRIHEFSHLFLGAKALALAPWPKGGRVGYVSPSGAFIVHISDLVTRGLALEFPAVTQATLARLQAMSPPFIAVRNPVDVFPAATVHGMEAAYRDALAAVIADPRVDAVVTILILVEALGVPDLGFIIELARRHKEKPIYVSFSGDRACNERAKALLEPNGVPTFPLIEDPFKALDIAVRAGRALAGRSRG